MTRRRRTWSSFAQSALAVSLGIVTALALAAPARAGDEPGHSQHGVAFDSGMRQKPWHMEGIGKSHFPISTKVPEVQEWFDQGNTLLHSFWFEEAERSFRWALKLDPDCAMAYWGLARTGLTWFTSGPVDTPEFKRYLDFLKEAVRRKDSVTPRERLYIEAWYAAFTGPVDDREKQLVRGLQQIVLKHPDDIEAKSLFALFSIRLGNALGTELVLQQVFAKDPDHPGAHHYRIHDWDGVASEQGIESCRRYGTAAPNIGHSNHMPGHIYSKIGMWKEAARSMDAATRVELRYMNERLALPFETWNYPHNRNYLCYIQEQLGMPETSIRGARDLLAAPRDPEKNKDDSYNAFDQGMTALVRALIKFERWDEILEPKAIPWRDLDSDKDLRGWAETLAFIGQGRLVDAKFRLDEWKTVLRAEAAKEKPGKIDVPDLGPFGWSTGRVNAAEGLLLVARGKIVEGTALFGDAATRESKLREAERYATDPPFDPWPVTRKLGDVYLANGDHKIAIDAYQQALQYEPNDAFSLFGLARAHLALGDRESAAKYFGRVFYVWSNAEPGLKWNKGADAFGLALASLGKGARATKLTVQPIAETPAPERPYTPETLASLGPLNWEPYAAPKLEGVDSEAKPVRLEDFRGKNVLLIFYLNDECVHCVEQLKAINSKSDDWDRENTVVLAMSSVTPEKNKESQKLGKLALRLLSDTNHENARRFASYDDFEELELHSTILIDTKGRVHWKRTGGDPFTDVDFLIKTVKQMNGKP